GASKGERIQREEFEKMLKEYYKLRGWNEEGIPPST
ncbi:aldehyde ferredoxin oxidoreductase C-terminal domain-containing protein, partial [Candidatus Culexarchaeum yellowstonense]